MQADIPRIHAIWKSTPEQLSRENNKFVFRENIRLGKRIYEASDWPAYRTVVENQKFFQNTPLIVVKPTL